MHLNWLWITGLHVLFSRTVWHIRSIAAAENRQKKALRGSGRLMVFFRYFVLQTSLAKEEKQFNGTYPGLGRKF
jgi:hypothetical protein